MRLTDARKHCHQAIQLNTYLTRAFVPAQPDDSHTALAWLPEWNALAGQPLPAKRGGLRLALRLDNLVFTLLDHNGHQLDSFSLDGRRFEDARNWLAGHLRAIRIDPMPLWAPLHFELDDHPLAHPAPFSIRGHETEFQELSADYGDAASILSAIASADLRASPVRCWPHHFDIATLLTLGGGGETAHTLGVGMSPGDGSYADPTIT